MDSQTLDTFNEMRRAFEAMRKEWAEDFNGHREHVSQEIANLREENRQLRAQLLGVIALRTLDEAREAAEKESPTGGDRYIVTLKGTMRQYTFGDDNFRNAVLPALAPLARATPEYILEMLASGVPVERKDFVIAKALPL